MSLQVLRIATTGLSEELLAPHAHLLRALAVREAAHVVGGEPALAAEFLD